MRAVYLFIVFVVFCCNVNFAQQSLYLPFEGSVPETKAIQTLSKPIGNDPFRSIQSALYKSILQQDNDYFTVLVDSTFSFNSRTKGYDPNTREVKIDEMEGLILNFDLSQVEGVFVSDITSIEVVVEYFERKSEEWRRDTLSTIGISESCIDQNYSYLVRSITERNEKEANVKYLKSIFNNEIERDLLGANLETISYSDFKNGLTRIDTVFMCTYTISGEEMSIGETVLEWNDFHPFYQSQIDFCANPLQMNITHHYLGLNQKVIDDVTEEFMYYWPTFYIENKTEE